MEGEDAGGVAARQDGRNHERDKRGRIADLFIASSTS